MSQSGPAHDDNQRSERVPFAGMARVSKCLLLSAAETER
jgi:hypothetical protein